VTKALNARENRKENKHINPSL